MCDGTNLESKNVKIRKRRVCFGCSKLFPIGTEMNRLSTAIDGTIEHSYWCLSCQDWFSDNPNECIMPGELDDNDWFSENLDSLIPDGISNPWPLVNQRK